MDAHWTMSTGMETQLPGCSQGGGECGISRRELLVMDDKSFELHDD